MGVDFMGLPRARAYAPEVTGAVLAVAVTVAIWFASGNIGDALHWHANRRLITSGGAAIAALTDSVALLTVVLVAHARQTRSVTAFFTEVVAKRSSVWRRGMLYFLAYEWPAALALFVLSLL
jgi:hypothetical protein